ncbi:NADP-dependent oxidoreductase domain-containing protein, partial [Mycena albidolilacea]
MSKNGKRVALAVIVLGYISYGNPNWWGNWVLEEEASKHIKAVYDAGVNVFDTANAYSSGISEEILGRAIKQHQLPRDEIVVMTKVFFPLSRDKTSFLYGGPAVDADGYVNQYGLSRKMQALHDVVKAGYVRYIGMSSCHAWQYYAIVNKLAPFISMQNHYNLLYREEEREMFPTLK